MKRISDFQIKISRFKHMNTPSQLLFDSSSLRSPSNNLCSPNYLQHFQTAPSILDSKKVQKVKQFLKRQKGSTNPITYNKSYGFNQKWESLSKEHEDNSHLRQITGKFKVINFIMFPFFIFHLWFMSVYRVFRYENSQWLFYFGLVLELTAIIYQSIAIASYANWKSTIYNHFDTLIKKKGLFLSGSIYSILYYSIALANNPLEELDDLYLLPFDAVLIFYKYQVLQEIYSIIRIQVIGSKYKLFMNLFDLASNIFMMIHFFAVLLFLCTYYRSQSNWYTISPIAADGWIGQYVQSFYFACTTMLTVGFGDIRPTNLLEISCILVVQLVGIMNNAYVISQIGANLLLIHQERNILQKDIANAQKIIKSNELGPVIGNKMMDYLVNNQPVNEQLSIVEEQILLDKLSEQFKAQVKENTQLKVIKKNLFFITNFTGRFQNELSKKLIKTIYPPHSILPNHLGKERLYIIAKGAVDIVTQKKFKAGFFPQKIIKSFNIDKSNSLNAIYGYAALFSGKQTRIKAVTSNFSVCYYLEQHQILQCIQKFTDDFERYCEIKHRIQLLPIPQKYQIPDIISNRQNYIPNIYVLIKKAKVNRQNSRRRRFIRGDRRVGKMIQNFEDEIYKSENVPTSSGESVGNLQQSRKKYQDSFVLPTIQLPLITKPRSQRSCNNPQLIQKYEELRKLRLKQKQDEEVQTFSFNESMKEYKNYFPKSNLKNISERYNRGKKDPADEGHTLTMNSTRLDELKWKRLKSGSK